MVSQRFVVDSREAGGGRLLSHQQALGAVLGRTVL
jgi:hypothetical protein